MNYKTSIIPIYYVNVINPYFVFSGICGGS
jgi:hypothetical protein